MKIIGDLTGGLGNLLFDCAHLYTLGKKLNIPVEYHLRSSFYPSIDKVNRSTQINEWKSGMFDRIFRNLNIEFDEIPHNINKFAIDKFCKNPNNFVIQDEIFLWGCWPSFEDLNVKEIQKLFSIDNQTKQEIEEKYKDILKLENKVSINVRRGDFLLYGCPNLLDNTTFYQDAISICPKESNFIVISDGIEDCKKYFNDDNFYFIENSKPLEDFYLQTYCRINILANSTFSNWAAYLNQTPNQIIIKRNDYINLVKENTQIIYI